MFNPFLQDLLGWVPGSAANSNTTQSLSTGNRVAMGFMTRDNTTLSTVRLYVNAVTSAPTTADFVCDIYAGGASGPTGSVLETKNAASTPSVGFVSFTGFTQALTANTQFWAVFRNNTAAPSVTIRKPTGQYQPAGTSSIFGFGYRLSNDSGATWTADSQFGRLTAIFGFGNGNFTGFPVQSETRGDVLSAGDRVQSAQEMGLRFSTPGNAELNLTGVGLRVTKVGSPAGSFRVRLYSGSSTVASATTDSVPGAALSGSDSRYTEFFFNTPQVLSPLSVYRIVLAATGADAGGNYYGTDTYLFDADSNSQGIKPFYGTAQRCVLSGGAWTDTAAEFIAMKLLLDDPPFNPTGGGGGGSNIITPMNMDSV